MTTRTGMNALISVVRGLADAGSEDWTNDGNQVEYWESSEIQRVLDRHRFYADRAALQPIQSYSGGTVVYTEYRAGIGDIESGTAVFKIETGAGSALASDAYTFDYAGGVATFDTDQAGSVYYWTGRYYDLNAAAAEMWRIKAANVAKLFNFSTDGHRIDKAQLRKTYIEMANYFQGMSSGGLHNAKLVRDDTP